MPQNTRRRYTYPNGTTRLITIRHTQTVLGNLRYEAHIPSERDPKTRYKTIVELDTQKRLLVRACTCPSHLYQHYSTHSPYAACKHIQALLKLVAQNPQQLSQWLQSLPRNPKHKI